MTAPQVTPPPETTPNKYGGDPVAFDVTMQAWLTWMAASVPEENAMAAWMSERANYVESGAAAAGGIAAATAVVTAAAAAAAVAKDQAIAAWSASMSPAETLPAISKSIHSGAIVKGIIYDTSKDSDGGAWRKRCTDKSWYTETLGGVAWLGQAGTAAAAWAGAGAVTGSYFQNTTDGKYYTLGASTPAVTECFRGNAREFPEQVAIIAEASRVIIYDLTQVGTPMWMVFVYGSGGYSTGNLLFNNSTNYSLCALNGTLAIGDGNATDGRVIKVAFIADTASTQQGASVFCGKYAGQIAKRNANKGIYVDSVSYPAIVNKLVNDVAITVLPDAPIDPSTGLPVPTISVATAGGVSVIKHDGTVVNWLTTAGSIGGIAFGKSGDLTATGGAGVVWRTWYKKSIPTSSPDNSSDWTFDPSTTPARMGGSNDGSVYAVPTSSAKVIATAGKELNILKDNPTDPTKGMVTYITNAYNSGWMVGDIRGAYLADTMAETITGSVDLVTNGAFTTDTSGWAATTNCAIAWNSGLLRLTVTSLGQAVISYPITTVVGKTYMVQGVLSETSFPGNQYLIAGASAGSSGVGQGAPISAAGVYPTLSFVATGETTYIGVATNTAYTAGSTVDIDNISVKLATPDRSVKNNGLIVSGSLTKTAVATGSALVAYSGFSATNYLEQPYNSQFDFGTGDFCVMGWVNYTASASQVFFDRATHGAGRVLLYAAGSYLRYSCSSTGVLADAVAMPVGLSFIEMSRTSGVLNFSINGVRVYSVANTANVTNTIAKAVFGAAYDYTGGYPTFMALWRISATAPSADQIAHIYRTELPLFQPGAQCTLAGTSTAVAALAYDDTTEILHVGTSWGRSGFKDLLRVDSETTTIGAITSLSASQGAILTGGTSGKYYQPAMLLRDELRRKDEARKALGKVPVFFDFAAASFTSPTTSGSAALTASSIVGTPYVGMSITGTGIPAGTTLIAISGTAYTMSSNATVTNAGAVAIAQSSFTLQQGYTAKAVYSAGALKRLGASKDYLAANDGFRETINFGTSPGSAAWISIMAIRSN